MVTSWTISDTDLPGRDEDVKRKNILASGAIYAFGMILPKIISVLLLPIFTRYLGPEDYGILAYTNSMMEFLLVFSLLSLHSYVLRFWMDYAPNDDAGRRRLVGGVFVFLCALNVVILAGGFTLGPLAISALDVQVPFFPFFALALVSNFFNMTSVLPLAVFRLLDRPAHYIALTASRSFLQYGLAYILVVHLGWGVLGMYVAQISVFAVYSLLYVRIIWRHGSFVWDMALIRKGLAFSLPLFPGVLSHLVIRIIDRLMLEAEVSLEALGLYSIGYTLGFFSLMVLIQGGYRAFEPVIFQAWGHQGFEETWRRIRTVFVPLLLVAAVGVGLFGRELLLVLTTQRFYAADKVIPVVALAACLRGGGLLFSILLIAAKRTKVATIVVFVGAAVNVVMNLLLIPRLGILGAAWSSVAAFAVMTPLAYLLCERLGLIRARDVLIRDLLALSGGMALVGGMVYGVAGEPSWGLFILKMVLVLGYAAGVAILYRVRQVLK